MIRDGSLPSGLKFPEQDFHRTEASDGRLDQVQTDKCGEVDPVRIVEVTQEQTGQNEGSREDSDLIVNFHELVPF
jgi:hypothetical protein